MFEEVRELWTQYRNVYNSVWPAPDVRADLAAEVQNRLEQLDVILEYLNAALIEIRGDPHQNREDSEAHLRDASDFENGGISEAEYNSRITLRFVNGQRAPLRRWQEVPLFAESFYHFAWRVHEILRAGKPFKLDGFGAFAARGVLDVRNHLIQHPDRVKSNKNFTQSIQITDAGPVFKAMATTFIDGEFVSAEVDTIDRGLFRNAEEFRDEILWRVKRAIDQKTGRQLG